MKIKSSIELLQKLLINVQGKKGASQAEMIVHMQRPVLSRNERCASCRRAGSPHSESCFSFFSASHATYITTFQQANGTLERQEWCQTLLLGERSQCETIRDSPEERLFPRQSLPLPPEYNSVQLTAVL